MGITGRGVGLRSPSTGTQLSTADDELLRVRVPRYGLFAATAAGVFWISRAGSALASEHTLASPSMLAHLAGALAMAGLWAYARRPEVSTESIRRAELVCTALACASYCALVYELPQAFRPDTKLAQGLAIQLLGRAVYVPSSARRTGLVNALVTVPYAIALVVTFVPLDPSFVASMHAVQLDPQPRWRILVEVLGEDALWWLGTVVVSTTTSAVIYGLRREVRAAKQLGQYTVLGKLGQGGMGVVYRARHALLRRDTAVKVLGASQVGEASLARFEREVQATAALKHPNTVTIFDYGRTPAGELYYAMELLDGATLSRVVELGGPMPPARVAQVLTQVCGALAEAHDAGLIHRDIKPDNILLTRQGGVHDVTKVVDFGLVKELARDDDDVTRENAVLGTPHYLSPEAIRDDADLDARSDLYAVGAVAYFLLTGEHVFAGATSVVEVCARHLEHVPEPPSARRGAPVPADLEAVVLRCLAKSPEDRYPSAPALAEALQECALDDAWTATDARRWWRDFGPELNDEVDPRAATLEVDLARR